MITLKIIADYNNNQKYILIEFNICFMLY